MILYLIELSTGKRHAFICRPDELAFRVAHKFQTTVFKVVRGLEL